MSSFYGGGGIISSGSGGGISGVGIANIEINAEHHLIVYLTDGSRKDLGRVNGATFTPALVNGVLKWANDAGLENPESFDFTSLVGDTGEMWFPINESTDEDLPESSAYGWDPI